jgi:hypothetical protein
MTKVTQKWSKIGVLSTIKRMDVRQRKVGGEDYVFTRAWQPSLSARLCRAIICVRLQPTRWLSDPNRLSLGFVSERERANRKAPYLLAEWPIAIG